MPSTFTTRSRLEKQAPGENSNNWGLLLNENTIDMIDEAIGGVAAYSLSGSKTLTTSDGATDEARCPIQNVTGGTGGTVTIPNVGKLYVVRNGSSGDVVFTTGSGTTATIKTGKITLILSTGSNVVYEIDNLPGFAGLTPAANKFPYWSSATAAALADLTAAGRALLDDADAAAQVTTLGLAKGLPILCPGTPEGSEMIGGHIAPYAYTITTANCSLLAGTAAAAETVFTLKKGSTISGASSIGTATFAADGTSATISITNSPVSVSAGEFVGLFGPSTADSEIANLAGLFK